jgi:hypothetical protein
VRRTPQNGPFAQIRFVVSNGSGRRSLSPKLIGVPSPDLMIEQGLALQLLAEGGNGTTNTLPPRSSVVMACLPTFCRRCEKAACFASPALSQHLGKSPRFPAGSGFGTQMGGRSLTSIFTVKVQVATTTPSDLFGGAEARRKHREISRRASKGVTILFERPR